MSSSNDFFGGNNNNNQLPEWMNLEEGTAASHNQSNYYVYSPYSSWPTAGREQPQSVNTVVLKVPICREGCEERGKSHLIDIDGVQGVKCEQLQHKVTVTGTTSPDAILNECKKLFKRSNWWPSH